MMKLGVVLQFIYPAMKPRGKANIKLWNTSAIRGRCRNTTPRQGTVYMVGYFFQENLLNLQTTTVLTPL